MAKDLQATGADPTCVDEATPHPPPAPITFRVGVVGHRPNKLPRDPEALARLSSLVSRILAHVRDGTGACRDGAGADLYADAPAQCVLVSSLAEGADRLAADAAILLGYRLSCPLPFAREVFAADFDPPNALETGSRARFEALLATPGAAVFELDGVREAETAAYAYAAQVVLRQSDLLLAVWDGAPAAGGGGTAETVMAALQTHTPVLWLGCGERPGWRLLAGPQDLACLSWGEPCAQPQAADDAQESDTALRAALFPIIRAEIELPRATALDDPADAGHGSERAHARSYFGERRRRLNPAFVWKMFRDLVGSGRLRAPTFRVRPYVADAAQAWPVDAPGTSPGAAWVNRRLRAHYAWADRTADLNADAHRSSFIVCSLLAAAAVIAALLPITLGNPDWELACIVVELIFVGLIVGIQWAGSARRWHERWLECRVLAERIRELRLLIPFGGGRVASSRRAHLAVYGDPEQSWMAWHARAIARSVGVPNLAADADYARGCAEDLRALCADQRAFHTSSFRRAERIHEVLHVLSLVLFGLTIMGVAAHLAPHLLRHGRLHIGERGAAALVFIAAAFPALGSALAAINNLGEFQRLAKRSRAMTASFEAAEADLDRAAAADPPRLSELAPIAAHVAETMVEEVSDWRIVVNDRAAAGG